MVDGPEDAGSSVDDHVRMRRPSNRSESGARFCFVFHHPRNQAAWLSACCRRDLDRALADARKAVELAPDSAGYHDTLAEVLFQLGKKDEAAAEQKKAIALSPAREYFKKQLKRIQAGDPRAPRPEEEE